MPDDPNIPPDLAQRLAKLDLSNPRDLEQLFALEAQLQSLVSDDPDNIPQPAPPVYKMYEYRMKDVEGIEP